MDVDGKGKGGGSGGNVGVWRMEADVELGRLRSFFHTLHLRHYISCVWRDVGKQVGKQIQEIKKKGSRE